MAGRPTKFNSALSAKMVQLYEAGKTDSEVASITGISKRTIHYWKAANPEFLHSLKEAKDIANDIVVSSLFRRATGYTHAEEKIFCDKFGTIHRVKTFKHYPPDVVAQIYWLNNRMPEQWRNTPRDLEPEDQRIIIRGKRSFEAFCGEAGYPLPYPKQIEMMQFGIDDKDPRLLLGARGYGKSDYVTILGVAYDVYLKGTETSNLIISKSKSRNTSMIEEIAKALIKNGVELEKQNSTCLRIKGMVGKDDSVEVLTIKSSFRGRHPKRIIMDDPVTEEDTSEAMRVLVKKKYDEAYKLCKNIVIIGQPAHTYDLYAELRPNLAKLEIPHGMIPELDADLEAMRLAGVDEKSIQMSYHLKIISQGEMPFDKVNYIEKFPIGDSVAFIDPSEGGDYVALSIIRAYMQGVVVVGFVWKRAWHHCLEDFAKKLQEFNVKKLAFEVNHTGNSALDILRQTFPSIGITGIRTTTNKHAKIMSAGAYAHLIHLSKQSDKTYLDHVVRYEYKSKFDDAPDSLASCLKWIGLIR